MFNFGIVEVHEQGLYHATVYCYEYEVAEMRRRFLHTPWEVWEVCEKQKPWHQEEC
jgi:hypothetical protein